MQLYCGDPRPLGVMTSVYSPTATEETHTAAGERIVLGSGNLVYFPQLPGRADVDAIEAAHPGLFTVLREDPGIAFLLVAAPGGSVALAPLHGAEAVHHVLVGWRDLSPESGAAATRQDNTTHADNR